ncbi:hypothetical protein DPMN_144293 [Dreissena polymorpha]|uniref:Uncharacterized protein n=1 Tax=Dreissena polymorpha TaxID=45954 RepID=A0A9D4GKT0_DREPO|nr:hypothetical protein DPMN_144293 [Dreissena polymorpha]
MEIDVVTATNRAHIMDTLGVPNKDRGRLHKLGSGSSVSSFRGSNLSLDTVSSVSDVFSPAADDRVDVVVGSGDAATRDAWTEFENTVRNIDNTNYGYLTKKQRPNLMSSNTFQRTMIDIYGNVEYGVNPEDEILEDTPVQIA